MICFNSKDTVDILLNSIPILKKRWDHKRDSICLQLNIQNRSHFFNEIEHNIKWKETGNCYNKKINILFAHFSLAKYETGCRTRSPGNGRRCDSAPATSRAYRRGGFSWQRPRSPEQSCAHAYVQVPALPTHLRRPGHRERDTGRASTHCALGACSEPPKS